MSDTELKDLKIAIRRETWEIENNTNKIMLFIDLYIDSMQQDKREIKEQDLKAFQEINRILLTCFSDKSDKKDE